MTSPKPRYLVDTCSFIKLKQDYPQDIFPGVWAKIDALAESGFLKSVEDVYEEIKSQDDEVLLWAKGHAHIFLPLDDRTQHVVSKILTTHTNLIDLKRKKSGADPFLIAGALVHECTVVTEEDKSGGPHRSKIPDVCKDYDVKCIKLLDLLRAESLRL